MLLKQSLSFSLHGTSASPHYRTVQWPFAEKQQEINNWEVGRWQRAGGKEFMKQLLKTVCQGNWERMKLSYDSHSHPDP